MGKGDKISIELGGGPPWGFRLGGGADFGCPLEIAKLRKNSKAHKAGLEEGDVVTSIDHQDVSKKSHGDAMKIIELAGQTLKMDITKGMGPSADLMNSTSGMTDSMIINQNDGLNANHEQLDELQQKPVEVTVIRSREPSLARERSVSRSVTIMSSMAQRVEHVSQPIQVNSSSRQSDPWTVDVTSYQFVSKSSTGTTKSSYSEAQLSHPKPPAFSTSSTVTVNQPQSFTNHQAASQPSQSSSRGSSQPRSIHVAPSQPQQSINNLAPSQPKPFMSAQPSTQPEQVTSNMAPSQPQYPNNSYVSTQPSEDKPEAPGSGLVPPSPSKQAPPTSPKPKFKATPTTPGRSCPVLPSWSAPPSDPQLKHVGVSNVIPEPTPMFKVAKVEAKAKPDKWAPTAIQNINYDDPKHRFNTNGMMNSPQPSVASQPSYRSDAQASNFSPKPQQQQQYHQPHYQQQPHHQVPQAPPLPSDTSMSPRRLEGHVPGMINPLICDDSQGDFGANPLVRPDTASPEAQSHQKKIYADSTFYDGPGMQYPTIHEQVALCKEIANFLESSHNKRSKGGRMFMKRKQRSEEWSMDGQGQRRDYPQNPPPQYDYDLYPNPDPLKNHYHPMERRHVGYGSVRHHPDPIKSKLTHAELEQIQHDQRSLCKHDSLPPNIAFDINQALSQSRGKAGQIFERRRQRSDRYVVDENNAKDIHQVYGYPPQDEPDYSQMYSEPYVSPWQAAIEGRLDTFFEKPKQKPLYSQQTSVSSASVRMNPTQPLNVITNQPPSEPGRLNINYKTFRSVNAPGKQEESNSYSYSSTNRSQTLPRPRTRLDHMISAEESPAPSLSNYSTNTGYTPGVMSSSMDNYQAFSPASTMSAPPGPATSGLVIQPGQGRVTSGPSSSFTLNLRRPKDYVGQSSGLRQPMNVSASNF